MIKIGQKVRVNRFLTTDPYGKKGKTGIVIDVEDDYVNIEFADGTTGYYQIDTLELIK